jgi:hypothetical protein
MIDPISAFGMLTSAHAGIKKIISMGRDLQSASSYIKKYANAEAELNFGKERKKKKRLFGGVMDDAIDQHFKEEEQKRLKDELRTLFLLYGADGMGQWERLQATIAQARAIRKKELEEQARQRDLVINCTVGVVVASIGFAFIYYWIKYLKG